jgi:peroxiredoxin Q/BCP
MLEENTQAPTFELQDQHNQMISFANLSGSPLLIFFYPRDNTSGCTQENIDFNDNKSSFDELGITILGVSRDSVKSHDKFAKKLSLDFSILSDVEASMCNDYQVMVQKSMYGKQYMGIERSTFLIDAHGVIVKAWRKVKVPGHVADVLSTAKHLLV